MNKKILAYCLLPALLAASVTFGANTSKKADSLNQETIKSAPTVADYTITLKEHHDDFDKAVFKYPELSRITFQHIDNYSDFFPDIKYDSIDYDYKKGSTVGLIQQLYGKDGKTLLAQRFFTTYWTPYKSRSFTEMMRQINVVDTNSDHTYNCAPHDNYVYLPGVKRMTDARLVKDRIGRRHVLVVEKFKIKKGITNAEWKKTKSSLIKNRHAYTECFNGVDDVGQDAWGERNTIGAYFLTLLGRPAIRLSKYQPNKDRYRSNGRVKPATVLTEKDARKLLHDNACKAMGIALDSPNAVFKHPATDAYGIPWYGTYTECVDFPTYGTIVISHRTQYCVMDKAIDKVSLWYNLVHKKTGK